MRTQHASTDLIWTWHSEHKGHIPAVRTDIRTAEQRCPILRADLDGKVVHYGEAEEALPPGPVVRHVPGGRVRRTARHGIARTIPRLSYGTDPFFLIERTINNNYEF